jgi:Na+-driven multidrug efflux pump
MISVLQGAGDMRTPLAAMGILVAVDASANPILILGLAGMPRMGIAGSGAAYIGAHLVALLLLFLIVSRSRRWHRYLPDRSRLLSINPEIMRWCLGKGSLVGMQYLVIAAVSVGLMGLVNRFGATTSAAYGIAATIWTYVQLPIGAITGAVTTVTAHSAGAGNWARVKRTAFAGVAISLGISSFTIFVCYSLNAQIVELFLPSDPEAARTAAAINRIVLWAFLMLAITNVLFGILRAIGKVWVPFAVLCVSHVGVRIPFAYLLTPFWGEIAIWWSYPAGLVVALILTCTYLIQRPPWQSTMDEKPRQEPCNLSNNLWKDDHAGP